MSDDTLRTRTAELQAWRRGDEPVERLAAWITVVASNEARSVIGAAVPNSARTRSWVTAAT